MSQKPKKPASEEAATVNRPQKSFLQGLQDRRAILLPLAGYVGVIAVFYLLWASPWFQGHIVPRLTSLNAYLANFFLRLIGQNTQVVASVISEGSYSVNVKSGCDGLEAMIICLAGIMVYPSSWKLKWPGIILGLIFLFSLNLFRIITLYLTQRYWPAAFDIMHLDVWQVVFIILAILAVVIWINWAHKKMKNA